MTRLLSSLSVSLDGYLAGPHPTNDDPLGRGGEQLHEWAFANPDSEIAPMNVSDFGAHIMGRNMFGPMAPWDPDWQGWWGAEPPYHAPVFVLTHFEREPLVKGETTFNFVNDGIESALAQATEAAGGKDVAVAGGAEVFQQYLNAGLLDAFWVTVSPLILGGGARLLDGLDPGSLKLARVVEGDGVTHMNYER